ncbi:MAG: CSLREA domain-containing protein [bacterium]
MRASSASRRSTATRFASLGGLLLLATSLACDRTITVTSLLDENTASAPDGNCTLREALVAANTNVAVDACIAGQPGADVIALPAGTYALTLAGGGDDVGDLDVLEDVSLVGAGAATTSIDASAIGDRVLDVAAGVTASASDLTIRGGHVTGAVGELVAGGGIRNAGALTLTRVTVAANEARAARNSLFSPTGTHAEGGGIASSGSLTLVASEVTDNLALGGAGGVDCLSLSCFVVGAAEGRGGGIFASGPVEVTDTTVAGNQARGGAGIDGNPGGIPGYIFVSAGGNGVGGGVRALGTLAVARSTFSANAALGGRGGNGFATPYNIAGGRAGDGAGGAIAVAAATTVVNATITGNTSQGGAGGANGGAAGGSSGGAIVSSDALALTHATLSENAGGAAIAASGATTLANSILAATCSGVAGASLGGNVESPGDTCGFAEADDIVGASAAAVGLGALAANGGPTQTQAIAAGSAAAGHGRAASCEPIDQRGVARPASGCDSGAFEAAE